jgi:hypothetical protein
MGRCILPWFFCYVLDAVLMDWGVQAFSIAQEKNQHSQISIY